MTNYRRELFIARVSRHQFVEPKHGQSGHHQAALPSIVRFFSIEPLDEQNVLAASALKPYWSSRNPDAGRQPHRDKLGLDHVVKVILRGELRDVFLVTRSDEGFWTGPTDRTSMQKGPLKLRSQGNPLLHSFCRGEEFIIQAGLALVARYVLGWRCLKIERADAIGTGL